MEKKAESRSGRRLKRSLSGRILGNTTLNIFVVVFICCIIMAASMQSLANSILLDSLQPMVRQSAKTLEANIHMLADRMMAIAGDYRIIASSPKDIGQSPETQAAIRAQRQEVLTEAAETYELYTIALYDTDGRLVQGIEGAPESLGGQFFSLLKETDNLTTHSSTIFQDKLGIMMGMPVKADGETILYVMGVYKYDTLNDVIISINLGKNGMAYMANREGIVTGHPDQSRILAGNTLSQLNDGNDEAVRRMTTGETGATEFTIDGKTMLVAFSPIRGTQWSLVIQVPKADYNHLINEAMVAAALFNLGVLVVSLMLVLHLSRSISKPVKHVTQRMVSLSDGDLHTDVVHVRSGDELQVLTQTLGTTVESVNHYISDIQQVLTRVAEGNLRTTPQGDYKGDFALIRSSLDTILLSLNETISGFRSAASRLTDMSEELNCQSGELHQASLEQNQSAEALVQEVSHVKERLSDVEDSSSRTRAKTEEISQCIQEANTLMAALSDAMDSISSNAQEITKIAKDIEDIAFQTSILALNASVEAAHAGEAGKGFAVVAEEVKELASKSAEAAQNATNIVGNTRTIISTGVKLTADTAGSIQAISQVSDHINQISDQLVVAVQGQEGALAIMEQGIETISVIADRNLQNAGGMEQSSSMLAREAEALRSQVHKFTLKEEQDI